MFLKSQCKEKAKERVAVRAKLIAQLLYSYMQS